MAEAYIGTILMSIIIFAKKIVTKNLLRWNHSYHIKYPLLIYKQCTF